MVSQGHVGPGLDIYKTLRAKSCACGGGLTKGRQSVDRRAHTQGHPKLVLIVSPALLAAPISPATVPHSSTAAQSCETHYTTLYREMSSRYSSSGRGGYDRDRDRGQRHGDRPPPRRDGRSRSRSPRRGATDRDRDRDRRPAGKLFVCTICRRFSNSVTDRRDYGRDDRRDRDYRDDRRRDDRDRRDAYRDDRREPREPERDRRDVARRDGDKEREGEYHRAGERNTDLSTKNNAWADPPRGEHDGRRVNGTAGASLPFLYTMPISLNQKAQRTLKTPNPDMYPKCPQKKVRKAKPWTTSTTTTLL
jgi:hypothetical protein